MNKYSQENISQFIDNELSTDESLKLLKKIQRDPELNNILNRYEAISHAMKSKKFVSVQPDFAHRIQQEINKDNRYKRQQIKESPNLWTHNLIALAASFAIVSIILIRSTSPMETQILMSKTESNSNTETPIKKPEQRPLNQQINDYLQAHNSSGYSNEEAFVKLSSYSRK
jgi:sigma-E factor negative regulatory protein RseA